MCPETSAWKLCRARKPPLLMSSIWPGTLVVLAIHSGRNSTCPLAGRRGSVRRSEGFGYVSRDMDGILFRFRIVQFQFPAQRAPRNAQQIGGFLLMTARLMKRRKNGLFLHAVQLQRPALHRPGRALRAEERRGGKRG